MGRIRKISKIEYIKEEIKDLRKFLDNIEKIDYYTDGTILKCKLYDEEEVLRYFEIDIEELKGAYNIYIEENNEIEEIEQLLKIAEELNDNWLIVDCN